jgi:acyl carrier protein
MVRLTNTYVVSCEVRSIILNALVETKEILSKCLSIAIDEIGDDDPIQGIREMNSINFVAIVLALEESKGSQIDSVDLIKARTVRDLSTLLTI